MVIEEWWPVGNLCRSSHDTLSRCPQLDCGTVEVVIKTLLDSRSEIEGKSGIKQFFRRYAIVIVERTAECKRNLETFLSRDVLSPALRSFDRQVDVASKRVQPVGEGDQWSCRQKRGTSMIRHARGKNKYDINGSTSPASLDQCKPPGGHVVQWKEADHQHTMVVSCQSLYFRAYLSEDVGPKLLFSGHSSHPTERY